MIARVAVTKKQLRARLRAGRSDPGHRAAAASTARALLVTATSAGILSGDGRSDTVGPLVMTAYIPSPGEPDVSAICSRVQQAGGRVLLPIPRAGRQLEWALDDGEHRRDPSLPVLVPAGPAVAAGAVGLLEQAVQLVLVPALAVDGAGTRLGQGGGFYDRLLADLAGAPSPEGPQLRIVAVVHDEELLPAGSIPRESHDLPVGTVLTPTRLVDLGA
jgi:5-formyltetrahydrofolate cyclo-ligase